MFLSISGILIFAMLGTLVETARYTACANHTARVIRTSTEALMTEYSRPLYDNYGLFFLESAGTPYEEVIAGYAADTMEAAGEGIMDFLKGEIRQITVTNKVYLGDDKAAALQEEINGYMLRRLTEKQLNQWLQRSADIADTETSAENIEETVDEQREMSQLDEQLLELMKWIDGITVSEGRISCAGEFIKMFATGEIKSQNFGVTEPAVWKKMKKNLDKSPRDWSGMDQGAFEKNVKKVLKLTDKAIQKADELEQAYRKCAGKNTEYADHDRKMGELIRQMSVLAGNREVLSNTLAILEGSGDADEEELTRLWQNYDTDTIRFDYTGVEETGGGESPLDALSGAWGDGILKLVCQKPDKISELSVPEADYYASLYDEQEETDTDYGDRVTQLTEDEEVSLSGVIGDMGGYAMDEFCLDSYIQDRFSSYMEKIPGWKNSLKYQWEYIIAGGKSDKANLESVLNRLLVIRTPVNFTALYRSSAKKAEAYAAAAAIVGFTGLEPLIRLVQTLILIAWSFVEGLVDVAGLLQGRHVPVVKSPAQILTSFPELFQISGKAITNRAKKFGKATKASFGYREYLLMFLALTGQSTRLYRTMDLIQWDMVKNGYSGFDLGSCVYSMKVSAVVSFPARFFTAPVIGRMLGRNIQNYQYSCEIEKGYL